MKCDEVQCLLERLMDGELPPHEEDAVREHVKNCANCKQLLGELTKLRDALRAMPLEPASVELHRKLRADVAAYGDGKPSGKRTTLFHLVATHTAALVAGIGISFGVMHLPKSRMNFTDAYIGAHVKSLANDQLTEIVARDSHRIKPWFEGKVDYAPIVVDLADKGFPLIGARVDRINQQNVAVLVYMLDKHVVNLFVTPTHAQIAPPVSKGIVDGFSYTGWRAQKFQFVAVSGASGANLEAFSEKLSAEIDSRE